MVTEYFPDGTVIDSWFYDTSVPSLEEMGRQYLFSTCGIKHDGTLQTAAIQALIDQCASEGGGVIVVDGGTYLSGALFFPRSVNLERQR